MPPRQLDPDPFRPRGVSPRHQRSRVPGRV